MKPRIFLGSSAQQEKLLQALTRGLQDTADVDAWTTVFNPGVSTLNRLVELTREVDFAAFVPIALAATGRRARRARTPSMRERPVSTFVPTQVTQLCWMGAPPGGRRSSNGGSRSGSRSRTPDLAIEP
jgi:hypothetical protein